MTRFSIPEYRLTGHAQLQMKRRQITEVEVTQVLIAPEQVVEVRGARGVSVPCLLRRTISHVSPAGDCGYRPAATTGGHGLPDNPDKQVLEREIMKVTYDTETDTLTVVFVDTPVVESGEDKQGVILDYDAAGNLVSLEILDASERVRLPTEIEYRIVPAGVSP